MKQLRILRLPFQGRLPLILPYWNGQTLCLKTLDKYDFRQNREETH